MLSSAHAGIICIQLCWRLGREAEGSRFKTRYGSEHLQSTAGLALSQVPNPQMLT